MKHVTTLFFIMITGLLFNPVFVFAGYDCYVDAETSSGGDGSEDEPYQKISKALSKDCKDIYVAKGTYSDNILLEKDVKLKGKGSAEVSITGAVEMEYGSEIEDVEIKGKGVKVKSGASVKLISVYVRDAATGIETVDGGTLTVKDSKINKNGKGFYIQKGKDISITTSEVIDNAEEGIDIRSNVDGLISGNVIEDNGESGIEIILGKSEVKISNNKIKNNGSSGIAAQFYDIADKLGSIRATGNTLSGNSNYGIDCKKPSGGIPDRDYWSKSITFINNSIAGNKEGDFSLTCELANTEIENATKTKEEIAAETAALEEKKLAEQEALLEEAQLIEEEKKREEEAAFKEKELVIVEEKKLAESIIEEAEAIDTNENISNKDSATGSENFRIFGEIVGGAIVLGLFSWLFLAKKIRKKSIYN